MLRVRVRVRRQHGRSRYQKRTQQIAVQRRRMLSQGARHSASALWRSRPLVQRPEDVERRRLFPLLRIAPLVRLYGQRWHVPILREQVRSAGPSPHVMPGYGAPIRIGKVKASHSVCGKRSVRRTMLFVNGVAGFGKRRSPGRGGTYYRSSESETTCR